MPFESVSNQGILNQVLKESGLQSVEEDKDDSEEKPINTFIYINDSFSKITIQLYHLFFLSPNMVI